MEVLAKRLKWLREKKRFSQKEVAAKIGMTVSGYQKIEYDERDPKLDVLIKLAELYDVSVDFLLGLSDQDKILKEIYEEIISLKTNLFIAKQKMTEILTELNRKEYEYRQFKEIFPDAIETIERRKMQLENMERTKNKLEYELQEVQSKYGEKIISYIRYLLEMPKSKPYKDNVIKMLAPIRIETQLNLFGNYTLIFFGKDGYIGEYTVEKEEEVSAKKIQELYKLLNGE
jgi:transcriptional regulator with XRE-family HTH domain